MLLPDGLLVARRDCSSSMAAVGWQPPPLGLRAQIQPAGVRGPEAGQIRLSPCSSGWRHGVWWLQSGGLWPPPPMRVLESGPAQIWPCRGLETWMHIRAASSCNNQMAFTMIQEHKAKQPLDIRLSWSWSSSHANARPMAEFFIHSYWIDTSSTIEL